ncbi:Bifunctional ligase/repressor BirA [Neolewinella maritima]|uniref:Bifunctional ligase/repressor BirA n=1 Tax=Neolewinella maritima TaxID=1383882 RepID=A0ABM9AY72_9BACT|nr:biotin--[acetyl-CoA-carboxylase] ligase [Neolewinella maritima]CAH0999607.1 Bifunctional ligase/repressor BirA [Neolewinella maritima]
MLVPKVAKQFARLASTNTALVTDLGTSAPPPHGAVYLTHEQTAGRGQGSNHWHSSPGANLTLSVLLRPDHLSVDRLLALTQFIALSVADTVQQHLPGKAVTVKWPNDVYVGDQKIAGVLLQNGLRGTQLQWAVAGIGLNVNESHFPAPLDRTATSLALQLGTSLSLDTVRDTLFAHLTAWYDVLEAGRYATLYDAYHERLYLREQMAEFEVTATGERLSACIQGVDPDGRLILLHGGVKRTFALREVRLR